MPDNPQGPTLEAAQARIEGLLSLDEDTQTPDSPEKPEAPKKPEASEQDEPEKPETPDEGEEGDEQPDPDELADEGDEGEELPKPRGFKVKVAGQEIEVTEDELKSGYSRTADYTRKTTELAEQRKAVEAHEAEVRTVRQQYAQRLADMDEALKSLVPSEPDWAQLQRTVTPDVFTATLLDWQQTQKAREAVKAEQERIATAESEDTQKQFRQYMEDQSNKVLDLVPEWKDPEVRKTERAALRSFGKEQGFSDEELSAVTDARVVALLRKAMAYDKAEKAKPTVKEKIAASIRSSVPGSATPRRVASKVGVAKAKLAKTGRIEDAAAAIEHLLD